MDYICEPTSPLKQNTKMEVISPSPTVPFDFHTPCVSSYFSSPSSPQSLGTTFFYSAPSSPVRGSAFFRQDFQGDDKCSPSSAVPFYWEKKPGIPKEEYFSSTEDCDFRGTDFEFDFSGNFKRCSLSADELFDGGKIRPLKPPPGFQYNQNKASGFPKSPRSPTKLIVEAFTSRCGKKNDFDPFAAAWDETRKSNIQENVNSDERGREKILSDSSNHPTGSTHKGTRSLSPFRVSDLLCNEESTENNRSDKASLSSASSFSSLWHKKWKIKDLLLFRSASESWATDNDQIMKKNSFLRKTHDRDEFTESSFSSTASGESESSRRRSVPPISAHKFHQSVKRTVFEEMRKKSLLPHGQGILGCLGFHQTVPEIHQSP
ncbi:uncharacterized protein [Primulina huaijiensis]|uniref:uncharacterized protein n=2 Tax=Primulina huaijiensis TaxID=1492673 RepID=UPI003CC767DB